MVMVCLGDHASHEVMYFGMKKAFPSISVISEETSKEEKSVNFNIEYRHCLLYTSYYIQIIRSSLLFKFEIYCVFFQIREQGVLVFPNF